MSDAESRAARRLRALIVTGNDHFHHRWRAASARFREILERDPRFEVKVTEAFDGASRRTLELFDVVLLNYFGGDAPQGEEHRWGRETEQALYDWVHDGGGLVVLHGAFWMGNSWGEERAPLLELFGLGMGPESRRAPGEEVQVHVVEREHPITHGMPATFVSPVDDKYVNLLRAPDASVTVLAEVADPSEAYLGGAYWAMNAMPGPQLYEAEQTRALAGTDERHPVAWVKSYGEGRVFALALGHVGASTVEDAHEGHRLGRDLGPTMDIATRTPAYIRLLQRGAEWAATGAVAD